VWAFREGVDHGSHHRIISKTEFVKRCFSEYGLRTDSSGEFAALYRPYHEIELVKRLPDVTTWLKNYRICDTNLCEDYIHIKLQAFIRPSDV